MIKRDIKIGLFEGHLETENKIFKITDIGQITKSSLTGDGCFIIPSKIQYDGEDYRVELNGICCLFIETIPEMKSLVIEDGIMVSAIPAANITISGDIDSIVVGKLDGGFYPNIHTHHKVKSLIFKDNEEQYRRRGFLFISGFIMSQLENLTLPYGVTDIGACNFRKLTEIVIPETVNKIGSGAFTGCKDIVDNIHFLGLPPKLYGNSFSRSKNRENIIWIDSKYINLYSSDDRILKYFTPKINSGGDLCFEELEDEGCNIICNLTEELKNTYTGKITIPEELFKKDKSGSYKKLKVLGISDFAFAYCEGLQEVHIPESMSEENISDTAFLGNPGVKIVRY